MNKNKDVSFYFKKPEYMFSVNHKNEKLYEIVYNNFESGNFKQYYCHKFEDEIVEIAVVEDVYVDDELKSLFDNYEEDYLFNQNYSFFVYITYNKEIDSKVYWIYRDLKEENLKYFKSFANSLQ